MSLIPPSYYKKLMKIETYTRTRTLYRMKSWPTDIDVYDDERLYWFRNNKINKAVAWQCTSNNTYYFKTEEDLKAYIRDQNLDKLL